MKKIRCTLLCLTLLSAVFLTAGCRTNRNDKPTAFPSQSSSQENGSGTDSSYESSSAVQNSSDATGDMTDGLEGSSYEYENGAGSMSTDDVPYSGTDSDWDDDSAGDLGDDIGDFGSDVGRDITDAIDDLTDGLNDTEHR